MQTSQQKQIRTLAPTSLNSIYRQDEVSKPFIFCAVG